MNIKDLKIPSINNKEAFNFIKNILPDCKEIIKSKNQLFLEKSKKPYAPEYLDLYFLYKLITLNKRLTVLEFGSGWSTLAMTVAMKNNFSNYHSQVFKKNKELKLRFTNPFEIFSVENDRKFLKISKHRINKLRTKIKVNFMYSQVHMTRFEGRICAEYKRLPLCNPDFIYLDGPDQFDVKGNINGINIGHNDLMPIMCDILKFEFFLKPGTIICVDGRAANVNFLKSFFKRKWIEYYNIKLDMYVLYLDSKPLGSANKKQLKFYRNK